MTTATATTPETLRAKAAAHHQAAAESYARCDTDGATTQWAHGVCAREAEMQAKIVERGGWVFTALFDLDGNLVPARLVDGPYGRFWSLLDPANHRRYVGKFNPSNARTKTRERDAKKGFYVGYVLAPARAELAGSGTGLAGAASVHPVAVRTDSGFSADVEILDNGHGATDMHRWYDICEGVNISAAELANR